MADTYFFHKFLKKRLLALLIAISLMGVSPVEALMISVQDNVKVTIGNIQGRVGDIIEVPVSVTQPYREIASYGMQIDFDPNVFEVRNVVQTFGEGESFVSYANNAEGWIKVAWADHTGGDLPITAAAELYRIRFYAKAASVVGSAGVRIDPSRPGNLSLTDGQIRELNKSTTIGSVMIQNNQPAPSQNNSPSTTPQTTNTTSIQSNGIDIVVNGQRRQQLGTVDTVKENGKTTAVIQIDPVKLQEYLKGIGEKAVVTIPVQANHDVVVGQLNGQIVKNMELSRAVIEIQTEQAQYTLAASEINIDGISGQIGERVNLSDIKIQIQIGKTDGQKVAEVEGKAKEKGYTLITSPVDFHISAQYGDQTVTVERFNSYVERKIAIPEGVDASRITTGVVVKNDGSFYHVPTKVVEVQGKQYAVINSLSNSTYTVIWNQKEFEDVKDHWGRVDINDMGSRLIINGMTEQTFAPELDVTRAEFAAMLIRALGLQVRKEANPFVDVREEAWYHNDVVTAYQNKFLSGYGDGTFRPNDRIKREEAIAMIFNAASTAKLNTTISAEEIGSALSQFADKDQISDWAKEAMGMSIQNGIVGGFDGKLHPRFYMKRAEAATMIRRLLMKANLI